MVAALALACSLAARLRAPAFAWCALAFLTPLLPPGLAAQSRAVEAAVVRASVVAAAPAVDLRLAAVDSARVSAGPTATAGSADGASPRPRATGPPALILRVRGRPFVSVNGMPVRLPAPTGVGGSHLELRLPAPPAGAASGVVVRVDS